MQPLADVLASERSIWPLELREFKWRYLSVIMVMFGYVYMCLFVCFYEVFQENVFVVESAQDRALWLEVGEFYVVLNCW